MRRAPAICRSCLHVQPNHLADAPTCAAFPEGIPHSILSRYFDHRTAHPDDGGLRYELDPARANLWDEAAAEFEQIEARLLAFYADQLEDEPDAAEWDELAPWMRFMIGFTLRGWPPRWRGEDDDTPDEMMG